MSENKRLLFYYIGDFHEIGTSSSGILHGRWNQTHELLESIGVMTHMERWFEAEEGTMN